MYTYIYRARGRRRRRGAWGRPHPLGPTPPPWGLGPPEPPWATAAAAVEPGGVGAVRRETQKKYYNILANIRQHIDGFCQKHSF